MTARKLIAAGALALVSTTTPAAASVDIHAHRGAPNPGGKATHPENSMEAFRAARAAGADVVELDARLTADGVPVVMHDATLDRTTSCAGPLGAVTAVELAARCRIDTVGTGRKLRPAPGPGARVPTLREVLVWAKSERAALNIHTKNNPRDDAYDPTPAFQQTILDAIDASAIDKRLVVIQSFYAPNLDAARARGYRTALLRSRKAANLRTIAVARKSGYSLVSPRWPTARAPGQFTKAARRSGRGVVPYGVDTATAMRRAIDARVDGFITNDVELAMRPRQRPACRHAYVRASRTRSAYEHRLRRYRAARGEVKKSKARKLRRRALSTRRAYLRTVRARRAICAKYS